MIKFIRLKMVNHDNKGAEIAININDISAIEKPENDNVCNDYGCRIIVCGYRTYYIAEDYDTVIKCLGNMADVCYSF